MKDIVAKAGKSDEFVIASCATSTEEIGNPVHHMVLKESWRRSEYPAIKRGQYSLQSQIMTGMIT